MELMPGYQCSDVGVIPDDWDAKPLGEIGDSLIGLTYSPSEVRNYGTLVLRSSNVQNGTLCFDDNVFVDADIPDRIMVRPGDILVCVRNGSRDLIGKSALIDERAVGMTFGAFMGVFRSEYGQFLRHVFQSGIFKKQINEHLGATINQITNKSLNSFQVPLPPTRDECTKIANALSDVDALIAGLEKLIAKKRDLKQAAMQQLLTGQTRLPGFSGEWRKTVFSKILRHHAGNSSLIKGKQFDRPMPNLFPGFSASGQDVWCSAYEYEGDAIVVSAVGSRCGKAFNATGKWCAIANTHVIWPDETRIDRRFLSFFVNDEDFWLKSGSGQPFVLFRQTFAREVLLPSIAEQVQISDAISDLEAELVALKNRLSKTRELKQGMMQELLTGRTRLI